MSNLFNSVKVKRWKHNRFNLSYQSLLTMRPGYVYPFFSAFCNPNETWNLGTNMLFRLAPMQAPIMQNVDILVHYFWVPNRLLWSHWQKFWTQGQDGKLDIPYPTMKWIEPGRLSSGSLADMLRIPDPYINGVKDQDTVSDIDLMPFKAYQCIWNEFYRDENLEKPIAIGRDYDGSLDCNGVISDDFEGYDEKIENQVYELLNLRKRSWTKDYFTSALPFPQRGDEVELPLTGNPDLVQTGSDPNIPAYGKSIDGIIVDSNAKGPGNPLTASFSALGGNTGSLNIDTSNNATLNNRGNLDDNILVTTKISDVISRLGVDMSGVSSATINELRRAFAAQEFLEARARGGSRYIEQILSIFNQKSSDLRLQRPKFLGGSRSPIVVSDVLQTSQSTESSAQATPSGHGIGINRTGGIRYHTEEHGYIMGLVSLMPKAAYFQGMPREYMLRDALDFYNPYFAHLGEQEIYEGELYYNFLDNVDSSSTNKQLFGYTPRYAEYKTRMDEIHGDFRTNLLFWHMARKFDSMPQLNSEFLHDFSAMERVFNVVNEKVDKFWVKVDNMAIAYRLMPKYGTPRLL